MENFPMTPPCAAAQGTGSRHAALLAILRAAACLWLGLVPALFAQSDPLVSKTLPRIFSDSSQLWAFAEDGVRYSRIDLFSDPVAIRNGDLKFRGPVRGGFGRGASLALFLDYALGDSAVVGGVFSLDRAGKAGLDSLRFKRSIKNSTTGGAEISALALARDTLIIGGGTAGFSLDHPLAEGKSGVLSGDSLTFRALPESSDTAVNALRCAVNAVCNADSLDALARRVGGLDSIATLAVDASGPDSAWLLIGTRRGLRRGLLGGALFPPVILPNQGDKAVKVERIVVDAARNLLWVFTGTHYYFSDDHGRSFRVPPKVAGVDADPAVFTGFNPAPEAVIVGDTTYVNFNLDFPGLAAFRKDTVLANAGDDTLGRVLIDEDDSLKVTRGEGRLTSLATVRNNGVTMLAVGSTRKGLFYLKNPSVAASAGAWVNINSLKRLQGGLDEVITFPTLFSGVTADGQPEYVNLGYRLKKDGKVTITVYNYAMEKVRTLVKSSPRKGGGSRSENPLEDRWDGKDASGRMVSVGVYYILIESDKGEKGWGKAIAARGRQ
jgi:hypothetical protein